MARKSPPSQRSRRPRASQRSRTPRTIWIVMISIAIGLLFLFAYQDELGIRFKDWANKIQSEPVVSATPTPSPIATIPVTPSPSPQTTLTPTPDVTQVEWSLDTDVEDMLSKMTLEEKIGQLIIGGFEQLSEMEAVLAHHPLGGVLLFKKNIQSVDQVKSDIQNLHTYNQNQPIPLWIAVDQEGGSVSRMPAELGTFPSAREVGDRNDEQYAYDQGAHTGQILHDLGFNLDFAPVLDIFSNPQNTVIGNRAYGTTPEQVTKNGIAVMQGIRSEQVVPTVKHFPGHGDTAIDSHISLPIVGKSKEQLMDFEWKPFIAAIENDAEMVMVAHILLSQIDELPASLSKPIVTGILRDELGYKGVIITDDMSMGAITENFLLEDSVVFAIIAGCDIVLVSQGSQNAVLAISAIESAVEQGIITEERIDESVKRILHLKQQAGISQ